jgi:transposase
MPYSIDLRKRVIKAIKSGMSKTKACEVYAICKATVYDWLRIEKERGHLNPIVGFQKGHSHGIKDLEAFKQFVDDHPDWTQEEMAEHFSVGSSTIGRNLKKLGYSKKKESNVFRKKRGKTIRISGYYKID